MTFVDAILEENTGVTKYPFIRGRKKNTSVAGHSLVKHTNHMDRSYSAPLIWQE